MYLTNMDDWEEMSVAYAEILPAPRPARTVVAVAALPFGTDVSGIGSKEYCILLTFVG